VLDFAKQNRESIEKHMSECMEAKEKRKPGAKKRRELSKPGVRQTIAYNGPVSMEF
jgi:hypothetical protein